MLTLTLVNQGSLIRQKFLDFYGVEEHVEFEIDSAEKILEIENQVLELLSLIDYTTNGPNGTFLLLSDPLTKITRKIDTIEEFRFFIKESSNLYRLIDPDLPQEGNYFAPLVDPEDILDTKDLEFAARHTDIPHPAPITRDDTLVYPFSNFVDLETPKSQHDAGLTMQTDPERADPLVIKSNLIKLGASFPYLNEEQLMQDFERMSRMDEVDDQDLINLLKFGYDEFKNGLDKFNNWRKGKKDAKAEDIKADAELLRAQAELAKAQKELADATDELERRDSGDSDNPENPENKDSKDNDSEDKDSESSDNPENKDSENKDSDDIKKTKDAVKDALSSAKELGDEHFQKARNAIAKYKDSNRSLYNKLNDEIKARAEKLKSKKE